MTSNATPKAKKDYDFVTIDPKTNFAVEVAIVRYCPPDATYEVPLSNAIVSDMANYKLKMKLLRYISKRL